MENKNSIAGNVGSLFKNKTSRVVIILTFGVIAGAVFVAQSTTSNQQKRPQELQAVIATPSAPGMTVVPGTSDNNLHNEKIRELNKQNAEAASRTGESTVPRLTAPESGKEQNPFDLLKQKGESVSPPSVPSVPKAPSSAPVAAVPVSSPAPAPAQERGPVDKQSESNMAQAIAGMLNSWVPAPQRAETEYGPGKNGSNAGQPQLQPQPQPQPQPQQPPKMAAGAGSMDASSEQSSESKKVALKAGSIMHAVVLTSVNSDEPGPVLAQIVTGPYAGGRMLGKFDLSKDGEKMTLVFSTLTMQNADKSYQFNAFAVDPQTARVAVASGVDRHYLSRYGAFVGATFLKGYTEALTKSGTTQTVTAGAAGVQATTTYPKLNNKEIALSALGGLGGKLAGTLEEGVSRPPTVTLNSGTEIGILVMQDTSF